MRLERALENAFGNFATIIRTFPGLQLFRQQFFRSWFADCCHRFDLKLVRDPQFFARALVIESLHPMHHQPLMKPLQCEILPRRSGIIRMRDRRLFIVLKLLA